MPRVFDQKVTATMHRVFNDEVGHLFMRKDTQVHCGASDWLLGAVIMSNPGSYTPKYTAGDWNSFVRGEGPELLHGWGYPDMTMQNVIAVLQAASADSGYVLEGKIDVYNLSAVVQPNGEDAETYHKHAVNSLSQQNCDELLGEPWMHSQDKFEHYISNNCYHFVMIGFLDSFLIEKQRQVQQWASSLPNVFYATDHADRWSHPRRWRTDLLLREQMIDKLARHFQNTKPSERKLCHESH
ncbi:hypothetical protein SD71_00275 [Cohnella kolymensis]|uniref:PPPDE domain-containing protein n=1 Tax=Cohnella kolymensis TaxID=1590652 RepID=A0ABR5A873_9BACL|nr:hypothetical protein [Cohnella kolymensis]KIL37213.1 hypothetical protein SD71_00275 [Cohnella kolymensis]